MIYIAVLILFVMAVWLSVKLLNPSIPPRPSDLTDDDIKKLVLEGKRLQAIKWYRGLHGSNLKQAKKAIDKMISE